MSKALSAVFLFCISSLIFASTPITGIFQATQTCPAYLSKNQKTNPDAYYINPHQTYEAIEKNRASHPDWFRIKIDQKDNPLRWVSRHCGYINTEINPPSTKHCDQHPGHADAYVLALSWQPAFCETYGYEHGKAECHTLTKKSYTASHFSLHGFWPNQDACGINYGYCDTKQRKHHCDYPALDLSPAVATELTKVMPSFTEGSCLERHEWNKHGTCQLLNQNDYFDTAAKLAEKFNEARLGKLIRQYIGGTVELAKLKQAFVDDFGSSADEKLFLGCKQGMLVDVWVSLPAQASLSNDLANMIQSAPKMSHSNSCPDKVMISDFFQ